MKLQNQTKSSCNNTYTIRQIADTLELVDSMQRKVMEMYMAGYSFSEIAGCNNISEDDIYPIVAHCMALLVERYG